MAEKRKHMAGPGLEEWEKREICFLVGNDLPVPERYRSRLFTPGAAGGATDAPPAAEVPLLQTYELHGEGGGPWRNRLFFGDNRTVLQSLSQGPLRTEIERHGGLKLIYIDPPFSVGADFAQDLRRGEGAFQKLAYSDRWAPGRYEAMIYERLVLMRELLAEDGCIYVHCDWRFNARMRLLLDGLFRHHVNEIIWHYTGGGRSRRYFSRKHDTIFVYSKSGKFLFNGDALRVAYSRKSGYARAGIVSRAGRRYLPHPAGKLPDDVWDIPIVNPLSRERVSYPTQKPEALLERILLASSNKGDLVADFFCGSGTLPAVAQRLGRGWLACDNGVAAIHATRKRLIAAREKWGGAPFEILAPGTGQPEPCSSIGLRVHSREGSMAVELAGYAIFALPPRIFLPTAHKLALEGGQLVGICERNGRITRKELTSSWTDWIDYWAVDYDWAGGPVFKNGWQSFRGHAPLELLSPWRPIPAGPLKLAVKVIDILGNEVLGVLQI